MKRLQSLGDGDCQSIFPKREIDEKDVLLVALLPDALLALSLVVLLIADPTLNLGTVLSEEEESVQSIRGGMGGTHLDSSTPVSVRRDVPPLELVLRLDWGLVVGGMVVLPQRDEVRVLPVENALSILLDELGVEL